MPPAVWDQQETLQRRGQHQIDEFDEKTHRIMRATLLSGLAREVGVPHPCRFLHPRERTHASGGLGSVKMTYTKGSA